MSKEREAPVLKVAIPCLELQERKAGRALSRYKEKIKSAGSCPRHHCTSESCIVAFGPREHTAQLWPRLASLGSWGKDKASLQGKCDGQQDLTRHRLLQEAGCLPFPSPPLQWPGLGPRIWKPLVSQQFPSGCRVIAGDRSTLKGSLQSSCIGNAGKTPPRNPFSTCRLCQAQGYSQGPCSQAASSLFSVCIRGQTNQTKNRSVASARKEGKLSDGFSLPGCLEMNPLEVTLDGGRRNGDWHTKLGKCPMINTYKGPGRINLSPLKEASTV